VSRIGSSEYQLHLMKVSDRDRNVNKKLVLVVFLVKFIIETYYSCSCICRSAVSSSSCASSTLKQPIFEQSGELLLLL